MDIDIKISGVSDFMKFSWKGTAVPINQRSTIGRRKTKTGKIIPCIIKSTKYGNFCADLVEAFTLQKNMFYKDKAFTGDVLLFVKFSRGNHRGHWVDIDAIIKPMMDAVEASGAINNDSQVLAPIYYPVAPLNTPVDMLDVTVCEVISPWSFDVGIT